MDLEKKFDPVTSTVGLERDMGVSGNTPEFEASGSTAKTKPVGARSGGEAVEKTEWRPRREDTDTTEKRSPPSSTRAGNGPTVPNDTTSKSKLPDPEETEKLTTAPPLSGPCEGRMSERGAVETATDTSELDKLKGTETST